MAHSSRRSALLSGLRDGVPIALGYFAVAFTLGIAAKNARMTALQGFWMSFFGMASAGEYAAITVIAGLGTCLQIALVTAVTNARYLLMSAALSQRLSPETGLRHRLAIGFSVTDELFGLAVRQPRPLDPFYLYGAYLIAIPSWSTGTALGVVAGYLLPGRAVSALSVALFGMFLSVIIPPARKNRVILAFVLLGFAASWAAERLPYLAALSAGTRTILLTVLLAGAAAALFPVGEEENDDV